MISLVIIVAVSMVSAGKCELSLILNNKPQGKPTEWILIHFMLNKNKLTRAGFEPVTSRLMCQRSTNWAGLSMNASVTKGKHTL